MTSKCSSPNHRGEGKGGMCTRGVRAGGQLVLGSVGAEEGYVGDSDMAVKKRDMVRAGGGAGQQKERLGT